MHLPGVEQLQAGLGDDPSVLWVQQDQELSDLGWAQTGPGGPSGYIGGLPKPDQGLPW